MPFALAPIFTDHAVFQREKPLPVWGISAPGDEISVAFAGEKRIVAANDKGRWSTVFDALPAGRTYELSVSCSGETRTISDIAVGEVWLCSGQSNMQFAIDGCAERADAPALTHANIRMDRGNGWICAPGTVHSFSAVAFFFARRLFEALGVPIGIIERSAGGTRIEAWMSRGALSISTHGRDILALAASDAVRHASALDEEAIRAWQKLPPPRPPYPPSRLDQWHLGRALPTTLYERLISPLVPYAVRGIAWYQGESNAMTVKDAAAYRALLPALIGNWRGAWDERELPFVYTQLPNYRGDEPDAWAIVREGMRKTLSIANTAMAVTIDLGESNDVHPKKKRAVGERLALASLYRAYGHAVVHSGPLYREMKMTADGIRISFDNADGLTAKNPKAVKGFSIAGKDKRFYPAKAVIDGTSVILSSFFVIDPVAARYAWANDPEGDLINAAGLPASPFRTDD